VQELIRFDKNRQQQLAVAVTSDPRSMQMDVRMITVEQVSIKIDWSRKDQNCPICSSASVSNVKSAHSLVVASGGSDDAKLIRGSIAHDAELTTQSLTVTNAI
jgi:hypothetical protein